MVSLALTAAENREIWAKAEAKRGIGEIGQALREDGQP